MIKEVLLAYGAQKGDNGAEKIFNGGQSYG